jgi:hypothetical protein
MLDPDVDEDVIVTVAHPWGDIEAPLPTWIEIGPWPHPLVNISSARRRDGSPVPLEEIRCSTATPARAEGCNGSGCCQRRGVRRRRSRSQRPGKTMDDD